MNLNLKNKLILYLLVLSIVPVIVIGILAFNAGEKSTIDQIFPQLMSVADIKEQETEDWILEHVVDLQIQSEDPETIDYLMEVKNNGILVNGDLSNKKINNILFNIKRSKGYNKISVVDLDGVVIFSTLENEIGKLIEIDHYITHALESKEIHIEDLSVVDNKNIIVFSAPVFEFDFEKNVRKNKIIGFLLYEVDLEKNIFSKISLWPGRGNSGETLIVKQKGDEIFFLNKLRHINNSALDFSLSINSSIAKSAIFASQGDEGILRTTDYRGVEVLSAYRHINVMGWGLVTKIDASEAFFEINLLKRNIFFIVMVIIGIVFVASYFIAIKITRPILKLEEVTKNISKGDFSFKPKVISNDEIGSLAKSFRDMEVQLKDYNQNMEQKVKSRTYQLNKKTNQLERFLKVVEGREKRIFELKKKLRGRKLKEKKLVGKKLIKKKLIRKQLKKKKR